VEPSFAFVDQVVAARDLVVTTQQDHDWRLEPRESDLGTAISSTARRCPGTTILRRT
jgi:hypothetical protein